jgi:hypothetical protein
MVSTVSQGRQTSMLGIMRSVAVCSTGWWVGPSSPRPIESWVNTWITRCFISAAMRRALRAYSENIRKVPPKGNRPPCRAMPFMIAAMPNSRTP